MLTDNELPNSSGPGAAKTYLGVHVRPDGEPNRVRRTRSAAGTQSSCRAEQIELGGVKSGNGHGTMGGLIGRGNGNLTAGATGRTSRRTSAGHRELTS